MNHNYNYYIIIILIVMYMQPMWRGVAMLSSRAMSPVILQHVYLVGTSAMVSSTVSVVKMRLHRSVHASYAFSSLIHFTSPGVSVLTAIWTVGHRLRSTPTNGQVHRARSSLETLTHPSTNRGRRCLTSVNVPLGRHRFQVKYIRWWYKHMDTLRLHDE